MVPETLRCSLDRKGLVIHLFCVLLSSLTFINPCEQEIRIEVCGLSGDECIQCLYCAISVALLIQIKCESILVFRLIRPEITCLPAEPAYPAGFEVCRAKAGSIEINANKMNMQIMPAEI